MNRPVNVIIITDGDQVARKAVETAARNIGARCISASAGNPTRLSGEQLLQLIKRAAHDPVVVMLDDRGFHGQGKGESVLAYLARQPEIRILGVLAVASNTELAGGAHVDFSIDCRGELVAGPVDKTGRACGDPGQTLHGDTVELLDQLHVPLVIGIGDVGKMNGADDYTAGAPLTTRALREIIKSAAVKSQALFKGGLENFFGLNRKKAITNQTQKLTISGYCLQWSQLKEAINHPFSWAYKAGLSAAKQKPAGPVFWR